MLNRTFGGLVYMGGRKDDLSLFETEESVLVCTYGVGSMGLNLQCANNVVFYSQTSFIPAHSKNLCALACNFRRVKVLL